LPKKQTKSKNKNAFNYYGHSNEIIQKMRLGPLIVITNRNKYALTFQDNLTKFSKAIPLANQEAATVAKEFITKIVFEHEMSEKVLTGKVLGVQTLRAGCSKIPVNY